MKEFDELNVNINFIEQFNEMFEEEGTPEFYKALEFIEDKFQDIQEQDTFDWDKEFDKLWNEKPLKAPMPSKDWRSTLREWGSKKYY